MTIDAYYFNFAVLIKEDVDNLRAEDFENPLTYQKAVKQDVINTLSHLSDKNHHVAILVNSDENIIRKFLEGSGLAQYKIAKISIYKYTTDRNNSKNNSEKTEKKETPQSQSEIVSKLAFNRWTDAKNHYFYDSDGDICEEVALLKQTDEFKTIFTDHQKQLYIRRVTSDDYGFLSEIRERYDNTPDNIPKSSTANTGQPRISGNRHNFQNSQTKPLHILAIEEQVQTELICSPGGCTII